jgi:prepilin-type N-terminal cleavage/methylation domain-containing protein
MRLRALHEEESGFTIIEMMTVIVTIGVLATMAIPTFLAAKERAMDRLAMADLQVALSAAKAVYTDNVTYTGVTLAMMSEAEPSLDWVAAGTPSSVANAYGVSFRVWNYGEINIARRSESGVCFYLRTIDQQGTAPTDTVNVYKGRGVGTCSGNTIASLPTVALYWGGWQPP